MQINQQRLSTPTWGFKAPKCKTIATKGGFGNSFTRKRANWGGGGGEGGEEIFPKRGKN